MDFPPQALIETDQWVSNRIIGYKRLALGKEAELGAFWETKDTWL
jgi:hypothetical protein